MTTTAARVVTITVLILLGVAGILVGFPSTQEESTWNDRWNQETRLGEQRKGLDPRIVFANRLSDARRRIARQVIAGRLPLLEAAAMFMDLNESHADFSQEAFRGMFHGSTDDERVCRQVIQFVRLELTVNSAADDKLTVARLEQEVESLLHSDKLHLPQ